MCYHGHDEDGAEDGGDAELGAHVADDDQDSARRNPHVVQCQYRIAELLDVV